VTVERPRRGQRWLELGALALLIVTGVAVFRPFFVPLAWAAILAYATWPLFQRMETRLRGRTAWAAGAMTALIVLVVVAPAVLVSLALAAEAQQVYLDLKAWAARQPLVLPAWMGQIPWIGPQVRSWLESLVADPAGARQWLLAQAGPWSRTIVTAAGDLGRNLAGAGLALFVLFFLYRHGSALLPQVEQLRGLQAEAAGHAQDFVHPQKEGGPFATLPRPASGILTADFNFQPEDPAYARLQAPIGTGASTSTSRYRDSWPIANPGTPHAPTLGVYDKVQWPGDAFCCDYIFVTEDLAPRVEEVVVNGATDASDHQPVLLRLRD